MEKIMVPEPFGEYGARPHGEHEAQRKEHEARPRRKKIVICCDGTGNEFSAPNPKDGDKNSGRNSNVVKLYTALEIDNEQVGYYHPGVGTMGAPNAVHWWSKWWSKTKGLAFGAGFRDNVLDAYRYLMENYNDNGGNGNEDEVYIFGFSRGAYTARALAGLLHGYGLLCRGNEGHLPYAWRAYVAKHDNREQASIKPDETFRTTFSHRGFKVQFMGVWDTVSSVGWITSPVQLLNLAENDTILKVRHAVSIDEHRCFFQDNLFADPVTRKVRALNPEIKKSLSAVPENKDIVQVWFAGVHSDVGGSYLQTESGLSQITLKWMFGEVGVLPNGRGPEGKYVYPDGPGIRLNPERFGLVLGTPCDGDDAELLYLNPATEEERTSVPWMELHHSLTLGWSPLEIIPRLYFNMDYGAEQYRVPLGVRLRQLPAGSLVHPSVVARMDTPKFKYAPKNLPRKDVALFDLGPKAADGSAYYRYEPTDTKAPSKVFNLFDRYVVTWFFTLVDVLILLPALLWVLAVVLLLIAKLVAVLAYFLWFLTGKLPWFGHLKRSVMYVLHRLWPGRLGWHGGRGGYGGRGGHFRRHF